MLSRFSRQLPLLLTVCVSVTMLPSLLGDIFPPYSSMRQGRWFSLTPEDQEIAMKTKISEQPDGCWGVPAEGWSSNTQHLPPDLPPVPDMSSPVPRQSRRDRKSSSLISAGEFVTPPDKFKRRRSISKEVLLLISYFEVKVLSIIFF
jgi:hypothetical protein